MTLDAAVLRGYPLSAMRLRLDKKVFNRFKGFPGEEQNEDLGAYLRMSAQERIELVGILQRQYIRAILHLPSVPKLKRVARFVPLKSANA